MDLRDWAQLWKLTVGITHSCVVFNGQLWTSHIYFETLRSPLLLQPSCWVKSSSMHCIFITPNSCGNSFPASFCLWITVAQFLSLVCKLCKSYTLAILKVDILCIAYLIPFEIDVLHGIKSHQLIKLIISVIGQPHNCNCWQPGNFSVLKKCNGKVCCLIFEMIFMKDVKPAWTHNGNLC